MGQMSATDKLLQMWAKRKAGPPSEVRYPLLFHMLDVAMVTQEIWERFLHSGARHFFAERLGLLEAEASAWISFWAGLHDIGKASPVFQGGSGDVKTSLESQGFAFDRFVKAFPHGEITACVSPELIESVLLKGDFPKELSQVIGITIGGHHGTFRMGKPGPLQKGVAKWNNIRSELVAELASSLDIPSLATPRYVSDEAFYVLLAGLTSVADWIGSNEDFFPCKLEGHAPEEHLKLSRRRAEDALEHLAWAGWAPPTAIAGFRELFPSIIKEPRPLQRKIAELAELLGNSPGLVIIEAPMGEGKTEAAMYLADRWAVALGQKGSYFALPTQATSNQMFGRVSKFLGDRYPDSCTNLQLIHGGALPSGEFAELRMRLSQDGDSTDPSPDVTAAEWFLPKKRGLLAPFGVGTIDQALLSVLQTRHFFVRLFGLAQKTVIIDEVHAYDTYMSTLLERLIGWLRALGSSVILLSATLPAKKREDLVRAYGGDMERLTVSKYPRVTWVSGTVPHVDEFEASRQVELHIRQIRDDLDVLVSNLRDSLKNGGCVAIVCNTVKRAQKTYIAIKQAGLVSPDELVLLHSRYPFEEREKRENGVLSAFGQGDKRPKRAILVATQIIEQSLDVDFDLMVTDLAPADLVLQRAGRVHRHDNPRPPSMGKPTLWIRMPDTDEDGLPEFGASAYVYEPYFLYLSYLNLRNHPTVSLPDDIQSIIEKVYGEPEGPWPSPSFEEAVYAAKTDMERKMKREESKARSNIIQKRDAGDPLEFFYKFNKGLEEDNPDIHHSLQALTRLAEPSVQVVCVHKSPDGVFLHESDDNPLDMNQPPQGKMVSDMLRRSLTITDKRVVFKLINEQSPAAWKKCAALRHHRCLEFESGIAKVDKYLLRLDQELGLSIEDPENQGESEG